MAEECELALFMTVADLSQRIEEGSLCPVALVQASLARISQTEPQLNAFVALAASEACLEAAEASRARAEAKQRLGPLDGIPIALKVCC